MPPPHYSGAVSLGSSKYALPSQKANFTTFPSAVPSTAANSNALATREQIAASGIGQPACNSGAQLAIAQNNTLKEEVDQHAMKFNKALASAIASARRLLLLIRESLQSANQPSHMGLEAVDKLWEELDTLFNAASEAKAALPDFMERQKDNMSLYHNSMLNETIQDSQEELKLQHKKVNIQHSLILEHQQSFQDYKSKTEIKLREMSELAERVSRLGLEKGLLKTEVDNYQKQLEDAKAANDENSRAAENLCKELEAIKATKEDLNRENATLRETIESLQESWTKEKRIITDSHKSEVTQMTEQLTVELQKQAELRSRIEASKNGDNAFKREKEVLELELKMAQKKFQSQTNEHSKMFTDLNKEIKKSAALDNEVTRLQHELLQLNEIEKTNADLSTAKKDLENEVEGLKRGFVEAQAKVIKAVEDVDDLKKVNMKMKREIEELETEGNDLSLQAVDLKKAASSVPALQEEIKALQASILDLRSKPSINDGAIDDGATEAALRSEVEQWKELAQRSYNEFKEMVPKFKQAEQYRQGCVDKDAEIAKLKSELEKKPSGGVNDTSSANTDAKYWKDKYDGLLMSF